MIFFFKYLIPDILFFMKVSGMTRLNTAEYKFILIVVFLNFNLLLSLMYVRITVSKFSSI